MDTTNTLKSMKKDCDMYFPKGEGIKIISTEEEALINDTIYIMPTDCTYATMIVVDKCGNKRKIGVSLPDNLAFVDLFDSNNSLTKEGNVYLKSQIDAKIEELRRDTGIGTDVLDLLRQLSEHLEDYNNPHRVTKEQVGLGNVDNTSDLDKPISKAQEQVNEKLRDSISKQEEKACNAIAMVNVETIARTTADQNLATAISELKTIVDAINSWKTTLSQGDTNHMTDTLLEIIKAFSNIPNGVSLAEMFNQKLDKSSVVDNLTSILTNVPLSANQGQVLKTLIDCLRKDVDFALAWCTQLEAIKIRKPQTTLRKPDSDYKYFVVLDEEGNSKRVLAGAGGSIPNNTAFIDHIERDEKGEVVENVVGNTYDKTQVDNKINELNTKISTEATERRNADNNFTVKLNELQGIVDVLQNWKTSFSNSSDDDNIINNIAELLSVFRTMPEGTDILELINTKVSISSIVDNLDSLLTNAPLSAHQGKVLKDLIDTINNSLEVIKGDINTLRESLNTKANKSDFDNFKRDSEGKFQEHERLINTKVGEMELQSLRDSVNNDLRGRVESIQNALTTKAGVDAENLREEDVAKWKQKLGVGGQVAIEPMGLAYVDQTIPKGVTRTIDTTGAKLQISGLRDINGDRSFSKRLRMNDRGELAVSDEVEWAVNIPEAVLVNPVQYTSVLPNNTFNKPIIFKTLTTEASRESLPLYDKYMRTITENLFTRITEASKWSVVANTGCEGLVEWNDNRKAVIFKKKEERGFRGKVTNFNIRLNMPFPMNKNWVFAYTTNGFNTSKEGADYSNFLQFGFVKQLQDVVVVPEVALLRGNKDYVGYGGFSVNGNNFRFGDSEKLTITYSKIGKMLFLNVFSTHDNRGRTWAFDLSEIKDENLYFLGSGEGTDAGDMKFQPLLYNFKYYIDDRNIDINEDNIDSDANMQKLKTFKEKVATKNLVALTSGDWAVDKPITDGGNQSSVKENVVELYKNVTGMSNRNIVCSLGYTPNFKLPRNKNYYFKFNGILKRVEGRYAGVGVIGFADSLKAVPNYGTISTGNENVKGMNVGKVLFNSEINSNGGKYYTFTNIEIWKVDNIANIRVSQGTDEIYNIVFDIREVGDLRPASAHHTGSEGWGDVVISHNLGEYYIEE